MPIVLERPVIMEGILVGGLKHSRNAFSCVRELGWTLSPNAAFAFENIAWTTAVTERTFVMLPNVTAQTMTRLGRGKWTAGACEPSVVLDVLRTCVNDPQLRYRCICVFVQPIRLRSVPCFDGQCLPDSLPFNAFIFDRRSRMLYATNLDRSEVAHSREYAQSVFVHEVKADPC
jgi:hypothetical protein